MQSLVFWRSVSYRPATKVQAKKQTTYIGFGIGVQCVAIGVHGEWLSVGDWGLLGGQLDLVSMVVSNLSGFANHYQYSYPKGIPTVAKSHDPLSRLQGPRGVTCTVSKCRRMSHLLSKSQAPVKLTGQYCMYPGRCKLGLGKV